MKIAHNTYRHDTGCGYTIKLHNNPIITMHHCSGEVTIDHCEWSTKITCDRIHRFNPYGWKCRRERGKITVVTPKGRFVIDGPTRFTKDGGYLPN